jgi:hypothetical protein
MVDPTELPLLSHHPADSDKLRFDDYARAIAGTLSGLQSEQTGLTVGIFGDWGSGKSTLLKLVARRLEKSGKEFLPVEFEAWKYGKPEEVWVALLRSIIREVEEKLGWRVFWIKFSLWLRRIKWQVLIYQLIVFCARVLLISGTLYGALRILEWAIVQTQTSLLGQLVDFLQKARGATEKEPVYWALAVAFFDFFVRTVRTIWITRPALPATILRHTFDQDQPLAVELFREDLNDLIQEVGKRRPLIVLIDDLDRAPVEQVVPVLEAIKHFGVKPEKGGRGAPGEAADPRAPIAFVIAADHQVLEDAIVTHYEDFTKKLDKTAAAAFAREYLEKIIQIPFELPPPPRLMLENILPGDKLLEILPVDLKGKIDLKAIFAQGFRGTPREIIQAYNTFRTVWLIVQEREKEIVQKIGPERRRLQEARREVEEAQQALTDAQQVADAQKVKEAGDELTRREHKAREVAQRLAEVEQKRFFRFDVLAVLILIRYLAPEVFEKFWRYPELFFDLHAQASQTPNLHCSETEIEEQLLLRSPNAEALIETISRTYAILSPILLAIPQLPENFDVNKLYAHLTLLREQTAPTGNPLIESPAALMSGDPTRIKFFKRTAAAQVNQHVVSLMTTLELKIAGTTSDKGDKWSVEVEKEMAAATFALGRLKNTSAVDVLQRVIALQREYPPGVVNRAIFALANLADEPEARKAVVDTFAALLVDEQLPDNQKLRVLRLLDRILAREGTAPAEVQTKVSLAYLALRGKLMLLRNTARDMTGKQRAVAEALAELAKDASPVALENYIYIVDMAVVPLSDEQLLPLIGPAADGPEQEKAYRILTRLPKPEEVVEHMARVADATRQSKIWISAVTQMGESQRQAESWQAAAWERVQQDVDRPEIDWKVWLAALGGSLHPEAVALIKAEAEKLKLPDDAPLHDDVLNTLKALILIPETGAPARLRTAKREALALIKVEAEKLGRDAPLRQEIATALKSLAEGAPEEDELNKAARNILDDLHKN